MVELARSGAGAPPNARRAGLVVCRGCCCGSAKKDSHTDHAGQLRRLRRFTQAQPALAVVRTTDCLGPCEQSNVIVVRPSMAGRRHGGRPVWLGLVRDDGALDLLESWVSAGGPGVAPLPDPLSLHVIDAPKPTRSDRVR